MKKIIFEMRSNGEFIVVSMCLWCAYGVLGSYANVSSDVAKDDGLSSGAKNNSDGFLGDLFRGLGASGALRDTNLSGGKNTTREERSASKSMTSRDRGVTSGTKTDNAKKTPSSGSEKKDTSSGHRVDINRSKDQGSKHTHYSGSSNNANDTGNRYSSTRAKKDVSRTKTSNVTKPVAESSHNISTQNHTIPETPKVSYQNNTRNVTVPETTTKPTQNSTSNDTTTKKPESNATTGIYAPTTSIPETSYNTGYWIPIFNFGSDFYFLTNKGYAKLVNFPAPVIYSFLPVSVKDNAMPTNGPNRQDLPSHLFENDSNFADCYVNSNKGNLIPYSYFGSWVAVFKFQNAWNLQTYEGFVPLDLYTLEAPVTFEFDVISYEYKKTTTESYTVEAVTQQGTSGGLASWSEPIVVED